MKVWCFFNSTGKACLRLRFHKPSYAIKLLQFFVATPRNPASAWHIEDCKVLCWSFLTSSSARSTKPSVSRLNTSLVLWSLVCTQKSLEKECPVCWCRPEDGESSRATCQDSYMGWLGWMKTKTASDHSYVLCTHVIYDLTILEARSCACFAYQLYDHIHFFNYIVIVVHIGKFCAWSSKLRMCMYQLRCVCCLLAHNC